MIEWTPEEWPWFDRTWSYEPVDGYRFVLNYDATGWRVRLAGGGHAFLDPTGGDEIPHDWCRSVIAPHLKRQAEADIMVLETKLRAAREALVVAESLETR